MTVNIHTKHAIGKPLRDYFYAGITGISPELKIVRSGDNFYFDGAVFQASNTTVGATSELFDGLYYYNTVSAIYNEEDQYLFYWSGNGLVDNHIYDVSFESFIPDATGTGVTGTTVIGRLQDIQNKIGAFGDGSGIETLFGQIEKAVIEASIDSTGVGVSGAVSARRDSRVDFETWNEDRTPIHYVYITEDDGTPANLALNDVVASIYKVSTGEYWDEGGPSYSATFVKNTTYTEVDETNLPGVYKLNPTSSPFATSELGISDVLITTFAQGLSGVIGFVDIESTYYRYEVPVSGSTPTGGAGTLEKDSRVPFNLWNENRPLVDVVFMTDVSGIPSTGLDLKAQILRVSDNKFFDFSDNTFQLVPILGFADYTEYSHGTYIMIMLTGLITGTDPGEDFIVYTKDVTNDEIVQPSYYRYEPYWSQLNNDLISGIVIPAVENIDDIQFDVSDLIIRTSGIHADVSGLITRTSGIHFDISGLIDDVSLIAVEVSEVHTDTATLIIRTSGIHFDVSGIITSLVDTDSNIDLILVDTSEIISDIAEVKGQSSARLDLRADYQLWNEDRPIREIIHLNDVSGARITGASLFGQLKRLSDGKILDSDDTFQEFPTTPFRQYTVAGAVDPFKGIYSLVIDEAVLVATEDYILTTYVDNQNPLQTTYYRYEPFWEQLTYDAVVVVDANVDQVLLDVATVDANVDQLLLDVADVDADLVVVDANVDQLLLDVANVDADLVVVDANVDQLLVDVAAVQADTTQILDILGLPVGTDITTLLGFISGAAFDDFAIQREFFYDLDGLVTGVEVKISDDAANPDFLNPDFEHFYSYEFIGNQLSKETRKRA